MRCIESDPILQAHADQGVLGSSGEESNTRQVDGGRRGVSTRDAYRQRWQRGRGSRRWRHATGGVPDVDAVKVGSAGVETAAVLDILVEFVNVEVGAPVR